MYLMINQPESRGSRWIAANNIKVVSMSKHPGSRTSSNEEQCYAKYDRNSFHEHLEDRMNCIYHKLTWESKEMERKLQNKHGVRVTLYFKQNIMPYGDMCRFIFRESGTFPHFLMVDCKTMFENRKWVSFYTKKERADCLKTALEEVNQEFSSMYKFRFSDT